MSPGPILLLLLAILVLLLIGLWQWYQGWAVRAEAVARGRLTRGESTTRRLRSTLDTRIRRTAAGRTLEARLAAAGFRVGLTDALLVAVGVVVGAFVLSRLVVPTPAALVCAALAVIGLRLFLDSRRNRRIEEFVGQLPEIARVMSNASSAGLALPSALAMASTELGEPARAELGRVVEELQLGQSADAALENLERRMPSREVGVMVTTLVIQQRAGGDLVTALRDMAETLEERKDLRREVRTIMSGAIATSYIVAILGVGSLLLLNQISPGVVGRMTQTPIGILALVVGLGLYVLGFVLVRRATRIET